MKEIILYRHKTEKDYYLIRNWSICGGSPSSNWFEATTSIYKAIRECESYNGTTIKEAFEKRPFQNEEELKAKITITKDFEYDGYKGKLNKELEFNVSDFEEIHLVIKEDIEREKSKQELLKEVERLNNIIEYKKNDIRKLKYKLMYESSETKRLNKFINKGIEAINVYQNEKTLSVGYQDLKRIRGILQGNEFDLQMFEKYLQELKEGES